MVQKKGIKETAQFSTLELVKNIIFRMARYPKSRNHTADLG